jgi:Mg-chelatase subunit ChlD
MHAQRVRRCQGQAFRRRAMVVVQVAIMSTVIMGFAALTIDVGMLYTARSELQSAADSAALAAAARLGGTSGQPDEQARAAAREYVQKHKVFGTPVDLNPASDVELGRATYSSGSQKFQFQSAAYNHDAVRVTVRRTSGSANGALPLLFAGIYGMSEADLVARAAAVLIPRDIAVVIDLSGSMNDDSELRHYKHFLGEEGEWRDGVQVNLRDVWCALNGPAPARPYVPASESQSEYAGDTGPMICEMKTWGMPVVPETYDPVADTGDGAAGKGLWYIKKSTNIAAPTLAPVQASLTARGYSSTNRSRLVSASKDSSYTNQWRNRVAVILGLATWNNSNNDAVVQDAELTWQAYPSFRPSGSWTWANFIDYVGNTSEMTSTNTNLRYRFGLKTFTNFLLESYPQNSKNNILWQTPEQPVQAVKDAIQAMTDVIVGLDSMDHMSLEIFAQTAHHEINLSENLQAVPERLYHMQAGHYDTTTNMGGGLGTGVNELKSSRARMSAAKVIVLMSDGKPNIDQYGHSVPEGDPAANNWVLSIAQAAADEGMRIYTISVGQDADQNLMAQIASTAHGQHFHAEGTPEQYADQLQMIFRTLGGKRPVALIE